MPHRWRVSGRRLFLLAAVMYVVSWFLPVVKGLDDSRDGVLPGWAAIQAALMPCIIHSPMFPWYATLHWVASVLTNVVFLWAALVHAAHRRFSVLLVAILTGCALLNTHWLLANGLRAGYYLWAGSFFLMAAATELTRREATPPAARSGGAP